MQSYKMLQAQDPWGCSLAGKPLVEEEEPEVLVGYGTVGILQILPWSQTWESCCVPWEVDNWKTLNDGGGLHRHVSDPVILDHLLSFHFMCDFRRSSRSQSACLLPHPSHSHLQRRHQRQKLHHDPRVAHNRKRCHRAAWLHQRQVVESEVRKRERHGHMILMRTGMNWEFWRVRKYQT